MGFFSKAADPITKLRADVEARPNDSKRLLDLAGALKAKGSIGEAAEFYMRAADELTSKGFATKAVAIFKQVTQMTPKSIPAHEALAKYLEEMKVKEDLRAVLKTLISLYRGDGQESQARAAQAKMDALGPGR